MALTPNTAATFSMTLRVAGVALVIPTTATVVAQVFDPTGTTALSNAVPAYATDVGADFSNGVIAVGFSASDLATITPPSALIVVSVTENSSTRSWSALVDVVAAPSSTPVKSQLFLRTPAVALLRSELALMSNGLLPALENLSDDYLWMKLQAAEAWAARRLKVFLQPTEVRPNDTPSDELALIPAGTPIYLEAALDYEPDMFVGNRWGMVQTSQRPIIDVHSMVFTYPDVRNQIFVIPTEWMRIDKKYGQIRIVPSTNLSALPVPAYLMNVFGGNRAIPGALRISYTAGIDASTPYWADLIDAVRKQAILSILETTFPASSGSISADGLSQSSSVQIADWKTMIDDRFASLYSSIHGISMIVMS